ncbi:zinc-binding dehydrogenase [Kribbella sp. NBC_00709]|uniref:zinc-binding dehydrogenase n=1 Tax=Kribbella sp. NBC_00709 TaxID=2975972 RepID=UPI002E2C2B2F|nr:zinc-binding dehydrogenase [Kribbella sp. NBC_00709]
MKAVLIDQGSLRTAEVPDPVPSAEQVLVEVRAIGLNRADLSQKQGNYAHLGNSAYRVAGLELAGEVVQVGDNVDRFAPGDRVMALSPGACAELAVVDEHVALPVPASLSYEQAAAIPVAFLTEHDALVTHGQVGPDSDVLVTSATATVSLAGLQIARHLGARRIIGTTRTRHSRDELTRLGATDVIDQADIAELVLECTDGIGVAVTVDHVGGPVLSECLTATAIGGRYISVGRLGGTTAQLDLDLIAKKRLSLLGVSFRTRTVKEIGEVAQRMYADLGEALGTGRLVPVLDSVFPVTQVSQAQDYLERGRPFGKVVLAVP